MSIGEIKLKGLGLAEALRHISGLLARNGVDSPDADSRTLFFAAVNVDRAAILRDPDRALTLEEAAKLESFVARRLGGEPATRIAGIRSFWTMDLRVTPDVLDPRPDTETIVEAVIHELGPKKVQPLRILDLGTGTGALLLALLTECPNATGIGVDLSAEACSIARWNAESNGLGHRATIQQGRWTDGLDEFFDVVVSNPPYIETATISELAAEVREHDPRLALDGGPDGLEAYRAIVAAVPGVLKPDGIAVLELGAGQAACVSRLAEAAGLVVRGVRRDLAGIKRALVLETHR